MVGLPISKGKRVFVPGCRTQPDGTLICKPRLEKRDITLESVRPIVLKKVKTEHGDVMEILDDGGAQDELIDALRKYVEKRHL